MADYTLQGLGITPEEFLGTFFEPSDAVCLRVLSDRDDSAFSGQRLEAASGRFAGMHKTLDSHNAQNRGIFFVVNYGGHKDEQIKRINAQFVEMDDIPLEEQLEKIKAFPLEPSMIVKTRRSLHCYWLMNDAETSRFRHIQRQLVAHFSGDGACINLSRVMRIPGFYHCKDEPVLVDCIKFNPEIRYTQNQLAEHLPEVPYEQEPGAVPVSVKNRGTQKGLISSGKRCDFLRFCQNHAKTLSEPDWYAMITNLALFEGGEDVIHKLSRPYPKYSFEQTQAKIDHFLSTGTNPMTCARIAEHGFKCPRLGECKCKAPAGMAFFPMSVKELEKALASVKPKHNPALDIQLASAFINNYLYNVEPTVAEIFISNNIRDHFGFKASDIKNLPALYRELHKAFSSTQDARKAKSGGEIPAWYEVSERGKWVILPGLLADHLAETEPVIYCADSYYFYEDGVYNPHNDKTAQRRVRSFMNSRYALAADIRDVEFQWQMLIDKTTREINVNQYLLNFQNGLYNLQTDEMKPHDSKILSTIRLGGNYDSTAECPIFLRYLSDVLPETEIPLIQELLGYLMVPINKAQKCFLMQGKSDSGKSTLLRVMQEIVLRAENVSNITWQDLDEKFATVQLFGKLANIFADLPSSDIGDTGTFKAITGEDYISAQHKFKDYFSFKPFCRLVFSCNHMPKNHTDRSDAFYKRLVIVKFEHVITEDKKDGELHEKLCAEADGIIAWAMVGLKRLMENGWKFSETDRTRESLADYKADNSSAMAFVEECCVIEAGAECLRDPLYDQYVEFCSQNGRKPLGKNNFLAELDGIPGVSRGLEARSRRKSWRGIRPL